MKLIDITRRVLLLFFLLTSLQSRSQSIQSTMDFKITMDNPSDHTFHVDLNCKGFEESGFIFKMPVWSPGYYQKLDFAKNVENFNVSNKSGGSLKWEKVNANTWSVTANPKSEFTISYDVKTTRPFVGNPYLDEKRGYIIPAAVCLFVENKIQHPVTIKIVPKTGWTNVATGLEKISQTDFVYKAPDLDVLYDSPILVGNLEELPPFYVQGIPHYFIGYDLGEFDKKELMDGLQKIVETAVKMIGDIPYRHYTFIAIGPGRGGIEHLNSTAFGFNGDNLDSRNSKIRNLFFLAHEYFHHFNVKRIRPVELGPFDYDKGSRTNLLWVSEGLSVYYEYMLVRRSGLYRPGII